MSYIQYVDGCLHIPSQCSAAVGLRSWEWHEFIMQGCVFPQPHRCTHSSEGLASLTFRTQVHAELPVKKKKSAHAWRILPNMSQGLCRNWRKYLWLPLILFSTSYLSYPPFPPCMQTTASTHHCCSLFFAFPMFFFLFFFNRQWPRKHLGATTSDRRWRMAFCCVSKYSACVRHLSRTSHLCSRLLPPGSGLWCKCCWYFPDGPPACPLFVWRDSRGCLLQSL